MQLVIIGVHDSGKITCHALQLFKVNLAFYVHALQMFTANGQNNYINLLIVTLSLTYAVCNQNYEAHNMYSNNYYCKYYSDNLINFLC